MSGRLRSDDTGFTLPELLVTMVLMGLISSAIIASTVAIQRNLGVANATMNDMAANRIAIERVGSLLRGGTGIDGRLDASSAALLVAEPDRVRLYSVTGRTPDQNPALVEILVQGTDLVERIWDPQPDLRADLALGEQPTYGAAPDRERVIDRHLVSSTVFTYRSHVDDGTEGSRCGRVLTPATAEQLAMVDSVTYRLQVREPTGYTSAPSDLQGWARFASSADLGFSADAESAGCLADSGFTYQEVYTAP